MSKKEVNRYDIIKRLLRKEINGAEASQFLSVTTRQVRRLKCRVKEFGAPGLVHCGRGKPGNRALPHDERKTIVLLLHERYADFKPTFAAEKLAARHGIKRDPKTIRQIMLAEGLWKPRRKRRSLPVGGH